MHNNEVCTYGTRKEEWSIASVVREKCCAREVVSKVSCLRTASWCVLKCTKYCISPNRISLSE